MKEYDVTIIGGGPAGLSAAIGSAREGVRVLLIERDHRLGGILNQCIHNGFGLHWFKEELTGTEYAHRLIEELKEFNNVDILLDATCLKIDENKIITVVSQQGYETIYTKSVIITTGCREKSAGSICLTGSRPSGVFTAGMAQKLCNIDGYLVGKNVVILGSGDIGLIMARRMTLEGAKVKAVLEIMPYSSGLKRNIVQCLNDYDIPLYLSHTITAVEGAQRITAIKYAKVDAMLQPILSTEKRITCDALLLSVGLTPENEIVSDANVQLSPITGGAIVDENYMTNIDGIFAAGNCLHVNDLVDNVSDESLRAGITAANFAKQALVSTQDGKKFTVSSGNLVRYVLPQKINACAVKTENSTPIRFYLRATEPAGKSILTVNVGNKTVYKKTLPAVTPGEMLSFALARDKITDNISVSIVREEIL